MSRRSSFEQFPKDKNLAWMAGVWLENQKQEQKAISVFERAIHLDASFAAPLNEANASEALLAVLPDL